MSTLRREIDGLSLKQRAMLELRLKQKRAKDLPGSITRQREANALPLSFAQQRLWFIDQLEPGSTLYTIRAAVRLSGHLDVGALERTLTEIVRRHESLRTTFTTIAGEPMQVVNDPTPLALPIHDLQQLEPSAREAEAARLVAEDSQRPFDLSRGPLLRASLIRLREREHVVLLAMHHIISDGWSMGVLVREVATLYAVYVEGQSSPLPELQVQYADYATWQREWLQGEVLERQLDYWREQLAGAPPVLSLPLDHPRPVVQTFTGANLNFSLTKELSDGIRQLSQREGVTVFMTLLAAFQILLARYSGECDVCVGTPIANRTRVETENLIGFFVNTLVLRTPLRKEMTFRELLQQVRETTLGAYAHQEIPFEKLVEDLGVERSLSHTPLFQVMFTMQNAPQGNLELPDLELSPFAGESKMSPFDLTLSLVESEAGFSAAFEYSTELFNGTSISRMATHFAKLLVDITTTPDLRVFDVELLSPLESQQLLVEFNETSAPYDDAATIHQLIERQAALTPEATAVIGEAEAVSYRELNERANMFAHRLLSMGVGPEVRVGLMLDRGVEMVVAVVGTLKTGGAYVPLDPEYPLERLQWMIDDSDLSVLVTQQRLRERISETKTTVICIDEPGSFAKENPSVAVSANNLAYVIYTSGSTGRPKGVMVVHQSLVNHATSFVKNCDLNSNDRVLQFASLSFDVAAEELFPTLMCGATVVLRPDSLLTSFANLRELLEVQKITVLDLPAAYWHEWVAELSSAYPPDELRLLIVGGERPLPERVVQWQELVGDKVRLLNAYGPTETTITATIYDPTHQQVNRKAFSIPIGVPLNNYQAFILDQYQRPVPIGVSGELHLGGSGLARGYMNRPELTAEYFIPHPFNCERGARLYRTGDLARYLPSGDIEYLGRHDEQVKIRGFRIELGEIETVLAAHPAVREVVVLAQDIQRRERSETRLVAYIVTQGELSWRDLREHLRARLPEHMVPSVGVFLAELPLTGSGKLDRLALTALAPSMEDESYVGPGTAIEELLCGIWCEVLGVERVGVDANFFELGGHSLLATQVVSRVREAFGVELAVRSLFEAPTVTGMAEQLVNQSRDTDSVAAPPIVPVSRAGGAPLSFAQQRLWFVDQLEPNKPYYNIPAAVRMSGVLDIGALERTLSELIRRHEILRTTFTSVEGEPVQVVSEAARIDLPVVDLSDLAEVEREATAERLTADEAQQPFDLSRGPLLRAKVLKLAEQDHVILLTMHHIISDGWSAGVLVNEVGVLYQAFTRGDESPLPELPIQYADYATWQRTWLQGAELERQLDYWRERLAGAKVLELPTDRPRPTEQLHSGARVSFTLPDELSASLRALSRREGVTLFMTLLAALQTYLHRYTRQDDITIGTDIANRNRRETEGLIGFFINMLVMRADLSGNPKFNALLHQIRQTALGAFAHQDMPFEKLVEDLQPQREPGRHPLFDVVFAFYTTEIQTLELDRLELRPLESERRTIQYDLVFSMVEMNGSLSGSIAYDTQLFNESTITRMVRHFQTLLESIVADPTQPIADLRLFTEAETGGLALTNFPKTKLKQRDFENLLVAISKTAKP